MLKDLAGEEDTKVEFSVMVLGGAAAVKKGDEEIIPPVAQGVSGNETLGSETFWTDLKNFQDIGASKIMQQGDTQK